MSGARIAGALRVTAPELGRDERGEINRKSEDPVSTEPEFDRGYEWKAVALLSLGFGLVGIDRFMISALFPSIMADLDLTYQDLGTITAALSIAWGLSALIMGRLSDRWGRRPILIGSMVIFSVLIGVSGLATGVLGLIVARALMGVADGAFTPTAISATIEASPPSRHGLNVGIQQAMLPLLGLAVAPLLVTQLLTVIDWRWVFMLLTVPGLIVAALMAKYIRDQPREEGASAKRHSWREVIGQRNVPILMVGMLCWLTVLVTMSAMLPSYLIEHLGLSTPQMGLVMSAIGFGATAGCLIMPALSDRLGRKPTMIACTIGAALFVLLFETTGADPGRLFVFLFLAHFFNFALLTLTVGPVASESVPLEHRAAASGLVICVGELFGGGVAPIVAGAVAQKFGIAHVPSLAIVGAGLGFLAMLFLTETKGRSKSGRKRVVAAGR